MARLMGTTLVLLALLTMAGLASAQVAAPTLGPVNFPNLFRSNNPATAPWRAHSYLGAVVSKVEAEATGAPISPAAEGSGNQLDLNLVGGAFGLEVSHFEFDATVDASLGGGNLALAANTVMLGMRIGDVLGVGVGHEQQDDNSSSPSADETMTLAGVNVRLFDVLFLGASAGTNKGTKAGGGDFEQQVTRYGVGLTLGDANRFHLEFYHETKDAFADFGLGVFQDGRELDGVTVEALLGSFLVGYATRDAETVDTLGNVFGTEKWSTVSVGWYPAAGLSLGVFSTKVDLTGGGPDQVKMQGVSVGWAF